MTRTPHAPLFHAAPANHGAIGALLGALSVVSIAYCANDVLFRLLGAL